MVNSDDRKDVLVVDGDVVDEVAETGDRRVPAVKRIKAKRAKSIKMQRVAEMAARGWSPREIAKHEGIRVDLVYSWLKREDVWEYVSEVIRDIFSEGDRTLVMLYKKAMKSLDVDLSSEDPQVRQLAREQVIKLMSGGEVLKLVLGGRGGGKEKLIESIDDFILRKRQERGLEP